MNFRHLLGCDSIVRVQSNFFLGGGGEAEVVDGQGGNSERCLKWGGGRSLRNLS